MRGAPAVGAGAPGGRGGEGGRGEEEGEEDGAGAGGVWQQLRRQAGVKAVDEMVMRSSSSGKKVHWANNDGFEEC